MVQLFFLTICEKLIWCHELGQKLTVGFVIPVAPRHVFFLVNILPCNLVTMAHVLFVLSSRIAVSC